MISTVFPKSETLMFLQHPDNQSVISYINILTHFIDTDMSYARTVRTASLTSYPVRCKILHQRTASLIVTDDVTRPLLCTRITYYVTVITHGRCYARA
jgi:hypothetical protein